MSATAHAAPKGVGTRLVQAGVLVALFGLLYVATRAAPDLGSRASTIGAVGFLLLTGTLLSELVEVIRLPHLTGYLLAGIVAGPHVLRLIDHDAVHQLTSINALALALIALEGGAELELEKIRKGLKSLAWATLLQSLPVLLVMTGVLCLARPLVPFLQPLNITALLGVCLLWGVLAVSRSPSATLGILSQTRASGPIANHTLTFVMTSDVIVVVLMATALMIARPMIEPTSIFSLRELQTLGHELLGSVALGTTLGLMLSLYLRLVGKQLLLVFVALGFGLTEVLGYLRFDALLTFLVAGFVVQNLSRQGERFKKSLANTGGDRLRNLLRDRGRAPRRAAAPIALAGRAPPRRIARARHLDGVADRREARGRSSSDSPLGVGGAHLAGRAHDRDRVDDRALVPVVRQRLPRARDRHGRAQRDGGPRPLQARARSQRRDVDGAGALPVVDLGRGGVCRGRGRVRANGARPRHDTLIRVSGAADERRGRDPE